MRYFTFGEIARALISSSLLGFFAGGVYDSLSTLFSCFFNLIMVWINVLKSHSASKCKECSVIADKHSLPAITVFDFVFFFLLGIAYILLCYVTTDGIFRFYIIIPFIVSFIASKKTLGAIFKQAILRLYTAVYYVCFYIAYFITYPLKFIYRVMKKLLAIPVKYAIKLLTVVIKRLQIQKKQRQIRSFFEIA